MELSLVSLLIIFRLGTSAWKLPRWNFHVDIFAWVNSLMNHRLGMFVWEHHPESLFLFRLFVSLERTLLGRAKLGKAHTPDLT